jgi:flagellar basal body rod protein FlgB
MNLLHLTTDNIAEILIKIIHFTHARQKILAQNIKNMFSPGFTPEDLSVEEFSALLDDAIDEHIQNQRLVLRDTDKIKFGPNGGFEVFAVTDEYAKELLEQDLDEYVELQIDKLLENAINQRVAAQLLRQEQDVVGISK